MMDNITSTIRLNFTLLFSVIIHLIVLLGVGFTVSSPPNNPPLTSLDITLVKQQTEIEPEKADFLAQANNEGGGNDASKKAANPAPQKTQPASQPSPKIQRPTPLPQPLVTPTPPKPETKTTKVLTKAKDERKIDTSNKVVDVVKPIEEPTPPRPNITASDLILQAKNDIKQQSLQQYETSAQALNNAPKKREISSRTKQYAAAAYHEAWRKKVERLGNMNFPHEAKRQRLNGSLVLSVDINPDGSVPVDGIVVSRSSGHKILDDAAIKIVRLGAPYAPIPKDVLQDYDVITITRTWKFETDFGLQSR